MIFDDHDVHDDWNISDGWIAQMRAKPWWEDRILGAYMSYWIYQHLGNLSPARLFDDPIFCAVQESEGDCEELAARASRARARARSRACAGASAATSAARACSSSTRAPVGCSPRAGARCCRTREWDVGRGLAARGDFDHLVIGTSLPVMLAAGLHHVEAWNEAVCDGAWGGLAARIGEKVRQGLDLEHWAAFEGCFSRLAVLLEDVAAGRRGQAPATIVLLSGDVHHAYVAEAWFPGREVESRVVAGDVLARSATRWTSASAGCCERRSRGPWRRWRAALARAAGVAPVPMRWTFAQKPTFDNQIAQLDLHGREAYLRIEKTLPEDWQAPRLHPVLALGILPKANASGG